MNAADHLHTTFGGAMIAALAWPNIPVAIFGGALIVLVLACIASAVIDGVREWRTQTDLARDRQARNDKAYRVFADREAKP